MHTEISSDTHHSVNTDDNHNACDTGGEDPRLAKIRKPRSAPAVIPTTSRRHAPELHAERPSSHVALSTATPEIDDAQPQVDHGVRRPSSIIATSTARGLLEARLQHQRQNQLLSIKSSPSKASSNASGSGMM
ncbi:hypothetical protein BKA61DRAFT_655913 [Leptodontidium sp. MPI-SDFR-AT-0119]|nr:hypothetical protein BKA61DRAFT_655913 [Leptodontidium sp. MPI-SDFR-AT-0119]